MQFGELGAHLAVHPEAVRALVGAGGDQLGDRCRRVHELPHAVGGEAYAVAAGAEVLGQRGDEAHPEAALGDPPGAGRSGGGVLVESRIALRKAPAIAGIVGVNDGRGVAGRDDVAGADAPDSRLETCSFSGRMALASPELGAAAGAAASPEAGAAGAAVVPPEPPLKSVAYQPEPLS